MSIIIKLINDKFENDFGFLEGSPDNNLPNLISQVEQLACQHHPDTIYSWGVKKEIIEVNCDLVFDVTLFFTQIKDRSRLSSLNGLDSEIQESILSHPRFIDLLETVIQEIEERKPNSIAFICNHGKHRSVGWSEIMKTYFFKDSLVKHLHLKL